MLQTTNRVVRLQPRRVGRTRSRRSIELSTRQPTRVWRSSRPTRAGTGVTSTARIARAGSGFGLRRRPDNHAKDIRRFIQRHRHPDERT